MVAPLILISSIKFHLLWIPLGSYVINQILEFEHHSMTYIISVETFTIHIEKSKSINSWTNHKSQEIEKTELRSNLKFLCAICTSMNGLDSNDFKIFIFFLVFFSHKTLLWCHLAALNEHKKVSIFRF